jgi:hypothetical protein
MEITNRFIIHFDVPAFQELKLVTNRNFENTKLDLLKRARE